MTLEEKIEHLRASSMEEARLEGNQIIAQHQAALDQIFLDHQEVALRQSELSIKTETNNAKQQLNKAMAKAQTELKREQGRCQTRLKNLLFKRIQELTDAYMQTPEYTELIVAHINEAKKFANGSTLTVYINPSDKDKKEYIEEQTDQIITISKEDFMGGMRAIIRDSNILIDHSFKSKLAEEYENFLFEGGELGD